MKIKYLFIVSLVGCLSTVMILSCKKKADDAVAPSNDFDRVGLLTNLGNNIIIPNYQSLVASVNKLDSAMTAFNNNSSPTTTDLVNLQNIFKDSYRAWQRCSVFEIGQADTEFMRSNCNTFPVDTNRVVTNVNAGSYDLGAAVNLAAKGFPGIDYLLFGTGANNTQILTKYTTDAKATNRKKYLSDVIKEIKTKANNVLNSWLPSGGNYINTFTTASGTDIGSSVGQLVNQMDLDFEVLKNNKLGIPLGKQSNGAILPEKTEALYSGISSELALIQLKTTENIFLGRSSKDNTDGIGFDDYLVHLNAAYSTGLLDDAMKSQFTTAISKLQAVPDPLSSTVTNNAAPANAAYTEVQKLLVLLKTDMPSAMAIQITYADNDGD